MSKVSEICGGLQNKGLSYPEIADRIGLSTTQVNYYLHQGKRQEHAREYERNHRKKPSVVTPRPAAKGKELASRMAHFEERHNDYADKIAIQLNGVVFYRTPFDIVTKDRQFYEVKVTSAKSINPKLRMTEEEIKFMEMMKDAYHVIFVVLRGDQAEAWILDYDNLRVWNRRIKYWSKGLGGRRLKIFELSKKRLRSLRRWGL